MQVFFKSSGVYSFFAISLLGCCFGMDYEYNCVRDIKVKPLSTNPPKGMYWSQGEEGIAVLKHQKGMTVNLFGSNVDKQNVLKLRGKINQDEPLKKTDDSLVLELKSKNYKLEILLKEERERHIKNINNIYDLLQSEKKEQACLSIKKLLEEMK